ncbi:LOW QUALITY PROTEIN: hypothetical protein PHMEG_00015014 [Phytophthora megakarya]|uniref:Secreted protein n=1 Tax=Phytophthora megakarya TaxID=4795 RepID=A0A225W2U8_9STRA|nr:LOW QUALITY PROTEIN: hypothetical protein PHMEG_00015014 [Phytophthora megakarya]
MFRSIEEYLASFHALLLCLVGTSVCEGCQFTFRSCDGRRQTSSSLSDMSNVSKKNKLPTAPLAIEFEAITGTVETLYTLTQRPYKTGRTRHFGCIILSELRTTELPKRQALPKQGKKQICLCFLSALGCQGKNGIRVIRTLCHFKPTTLPDIVRDFINENCGGLALDME